MRTKKVFALGCLLTLALSLVSCNDPVNYTAKEEREVSQESFSKTQDWFNLNMPGASLNGCYMYNEGQLSSVTKGKYVYRKLHENGTTYTDYTFNYIYDYKNNVMYDDKLYTSMDPEDDNAWNALERLYGNGLGLKEKNLTGCNFDMAIPYVVYEDIDHSGQLKEMPAMLYERVLPVDLTKDEVGAYIEEKCKEDTVDWTVLVFTESIYDFDELNPEFMSEYPYVKKVIIEGNTHNWDIDIIPEGEPDGPCIRVTKSSVSGDTEPEHRDYTF